MMRLLFNKGWCVWRITSDAKGYTLSSSNLIALKLGLKQMREGVSSGFICVYTFYLLIYNIAICKSIYIYVYMYTQTTLYLMIRRSNNCTIIRSCNGVYNIKISKSIGEKLKSKYTLNISCSTMKTKLSL